MGLPGQDAVDPQIVITAVGTVVRMQYSTPDRPDKRVYEERARNW